MPGVINDSGNRTLRRELLAFGTKSVCDELQKRSVPLKLREEDPTLGRFYARTCASRDLENDNIYLQFGGVGYAWSNITKRVGFGASAGVEYDQDFRIADGRLYVYFRPAAITAKQFELKTAEQSAPSVLGTVLPGASPQDFVNQLGEGLLAQQLGRGFTVVRDSDGAVSFGFGMVPPGQTPSAPFERKNQSRLLLTNERVEIHQNQRDFTGPFQVDDDDMALYLTMNVEGTSAVDVLVFQRPIGEQWLQSYVHEVQINAPPQPPLFDEAAPAGVLFRRLVRVPKGQYYVVLDNTSSAGRTTPPSFGLDDRAAMVSLAVEVGDAP
jgi:hypothetical protein